MMFTNLILMLIAFELDPWLVFFLLAVGGFLVVSLVHGFFQIIGEALTSTFYFLMYFSMYAFIAFIVSFAFYCGWTKFANAGGFERAKKFPKTYNFLGLCRRHIKVVLLILSAVYVGVAMYFHYSPLASTPAYNSSKNFIPDQAEFQ